MIFVCLLSIIFLPFHYLKKLPKDEYLMFNCFHAWIKVNFFLFDIWYTFCVGIWVNLDLAWFKIWGCCGQADVVESSASQANVHVNPLGILLECRFWFQGSGWDLRSGPGLGRGERGRIIHSSVRSDPVFISNYDIILIMDFCINFYF